MDALLVQVGIDLIDDHPKNPRVVLRQDVIDGIAASLGDGYPQKHAVHVRKIGERYELISGHHRKQAAIKAGLKTLWAWVEELSDEAAFMQLVTSNNQGELDPLEIGIHAFEAVPLSKGGRGKKGGLSEYAEKIGKDQGNVSRLRDAGEVAKNLCIDTYVSLLGRAQHLSAIHKLPKECWQAACEWLVSQDKASVADVKKQVELAEQFEQSFNPPALWQNALRTSDCVTAVFCGKSPSVFERLIAVYSSVLDVIDKAHIEITKDIAKLPKADRQLAVSRIDFEIERVRRLWIDWIVSNAKGDSWDISKVQKQRIEIDDALWKLRELPEQQPVSVLLADPPWQYDFAETDSRQIENQYPTADAETIATHLDLPWAPKLADDCVLFMWATAPKLREAFVVLDGWGFEYKTHAVWDKEKIGMGYWFRGQHELLIVATRGKKSPPDAESRFSSVFREKRDSKHSKKPQCVYEAIEAMFPDDVKFEMYAREQREGWLQGGNEA